MQIEFDYEKHQYYVDGTPVPSVTQLVAPLGADYDEDDYAEITMEAAAERGTCIHAYIAHRLGGGMPDEFEVPEEYRPWIAAAELFLSEHDVLPLLVEEPMATPYFAGTPDLIAEFDGHLAILDWKCVSQLAKSKVGAQLNGYNDLCIHNGLWVDSLYAVQFLSTGEYRLYPVQMDMAAFAVCQQLYAHKTKKHPRGRIV